MTDVTEAPANRKQYIVRNTVSHRVVHTTVTGLTSDEASADALEQKKGFEEAHPEQTFEVVQA